MTFIKSIDMKDGPVKSGYPESYRFSRMEFCKNGSFIGGIPFFRTSIQVKDFSEL